MRFGAIQRGTLLTSQHQYPCMKGSMRERPSLLYWWSSSRFSCCRDRRDMGSSISLVRRPELSSAAAAVGSWATEELVSESGRARIGLLCELMFFWGSVWVWWVPNPQWVYGIRSMGTQPLTCRNYYGTTLTTNGKQEFIINKMFFCGGVIVNCYLVNDFHTKSKLK